MATKLGIFNAALTELGERILTDTGDPIEPARVLAQVYDKVVAECLAEAGWNFATETIKATADTGAVPAFGFPKVFAKPTDWVRTVGISSDEYFSSPLFKYYDDANYWSSDYSPIYVRYVSNDTGMGLELTRWPVNYERYVVLELAARVSKRLTQNESLREEIARERDKARMKAKNHDSMNEPQPRFPPPGGWTVSRGGRSRSERGNRNSFTG